MLRILLGLLALLLVPLNVAAQTVTHEPTAAPATERVTYIHTDALGSPILGTDAQGNVVWQEDYQPYGERFLGTTPPTQRLYTGKYAETRSGLVDYGGRWYNPEIGRFYSVDPQGFDEANPHSFNRYAYANNNPYRYVDPDGEAGWDIVKLAPAAGASFGALAAYGQGQLTGDAALVDVSVTGMNAMMGSNAEALASLVTPPGAARVVMNAAKEGTTFQTYTKTNAKTGEVYCGRTSGCGTALGNVANRDVSHHMNDKGFDPAVLDKSSSNAAAIRGREQQLIDVHGGARSTGGTSGNAINGISPNNPKRGGYLDAAKREFGQ